MAFFDKIKYIASGGKTDEERRKIAEANARIRAKALEAELQEREKQNVRLATERVRIKAEQKLKSIRGGGSSRIQNYGSMFGIQLGQQPSQQSSPGKKKLKYYYVKKGKKYIKKKVKSPSVNISKPITMQPQRRWDPIFGGYR